VVQTLSETQRGFDIVALAPWGGQITIEAKGETSSMSHSRRYGKAFSSGQVLDHVAKALYCAARNVSSEALTGVAFPKNEAHVRCVSNILPVLRKLGIEVFWVLADKTVEIERVWPFWNGRGSCTLPGAFCSAPSTAGLANRQKFDKKKKS